MDAAAQSVLAVAAIALTIVMAALYAIARRDRRLAGGRASASATIASEPASPATPPAAVLAPKRRVQVTTGRRAGG